MALAAAGADVAVNDFADEAACAAVVAEVEKLGRKGLVVMGDVSDEEQVNAMVERAETELGPLAVVVNNAGITRDNVAMMMDPADFDAVIATHLRGTFLVSKAAARRMFRRRTGCIINLSSVVGRRGNAGQANYAAAKAGIIGLTKSLAKELGARGVRVNAIAPGYIDTPMTQALPEETRQMIVDATPLKSIGTTDDVAVRGGLPGLAGGALRHRRRPAGRRRPGDLTGSVHDHAWQSMRRVVVTGLGVISPIGNDVDTFWRRLVAGESGVGEITRFDTTDYKVHIAAEVQDFVAEDYIDKRKVRRLDLFSRYAVAAAKNAAADADFDPRPEAERVGAVIGERGRRPADAARRDRQAPQPGPRPHQPAAGPHDDPQHGRGARLARAGHQGSAERDLHGLRRRL